jgi:hypothetical protein
MALVTTMPMSMSRPIIAGIPNAVPVSRSSPSAPVAAKGTETSRMSGCRSDRKVATMRR